MLIYILRSNVFLLRNDDLYILNQIEFDLKNINQEFLLFLKSLNKHSIQYITIEFSL